MNDLPAVLVALVATVNKLTEGVKRFLASRFPDMDNDTRAMIVLIASLVIGIGATFATEGALDIFRGTLLARNELFSVVIVGIGAALGADVLRFFLQLKNLEWLQKKTITSVEKTETVTAKESVPDSG